MILPPISVADILRGTSCLTIIPKTQSGAVGGLLGAIFAAVVLFFSHAVLCWAAILGATWIAVLAQAETCWSRH